MRIVNAKTLQVEFPVSRLRQAVFWISVRPGSHHPRRAEAGAVDSLDAANGTRWVTARPGSGPFERGPIRRGPVAHGRDPSDGRLGALGDGGSWADATANESDLKRLLVSITRSPSFGTCPNRDLGHTKPGNHRALRRSDPEVVLCEGKTVDQASEIICPQVLETSEILRPTGTVPAVFDSVRELHPDMHCNALVRSIALRRQPASSSSRRASKKSSSVMPSASWVRRSTVTRLYTLHHSGW
jgi:hypothetical protein